MRYFILIATVIGFTQPAGASLARSQIDDLLSCYAHQSQHLHGKAKYDFVFRTIPSEQLYKLFIDKKRLAHPEPQEAGVAPHLIFDVKEPGFYDSMMRAFDQMSSTIGQPLTLDTIIELHDTAVGGVENISNEKGLSAISPKYTLDHTGDVVDKNALIELVKSGVAYDLQTFMNMMSPDHNCRGPCLSRFDEIFDNHKPPALTQISSAGTVQTMSDGIEADVKKATQPYLDYYQHSVAGLKTLEGKFEAIAEILRTFEMAHVFSDGNQRTYAFVILDKLLAENGIPPAILDSPFMFDGYYTVKTMAKMLKTGVSNFLNENEDAEGSWLAHECANIDADDPTYLSSTSDYKPYFTLGRGFDQQVMATKSQLADEVRNAITTGQFLQPDSEGRTPLVKAVLIGDKVLAKQLIDHGAYGSTDPIDLAIDLGNMKMLKLLVEKMPEGLTRNKYFPSSPILFAANVGNADAFNYFIAKLPAARLTEKDTGGESAAHYAARKGWVSILQAIASHPNLRNMLVEKNVLGKTPLRVAIESGGDRGAIKAIRFLVEDLPAEALGVLDDDKNTLLMTAISAMQNRSNKLETVKLLSAKMSKDALNSKGGRRSESALQLAKGDSEIEAILKAAGAE